MGITAGLGNAIVPASYGFRNLIINGNFSINQRAYTSASNLASGSYGFDRWKSNYTNTTLTFTSAPQGQTVTISASGVIRQVVEQANVRAGSYVLSWTGTATGRVYNSGGSAPSYAVSPVSAYLDGTADVIVEFTPSSGTATLGDVQLEFGSRATPFETRPIGVELVLCQRYCFVVSDTSTAQQYAFCSGVMASTTTPIMYLKYPTTMRSLPSLSSTGTFQVRTSAVLTCSGQPSFNATGLDSSSIQITTSSGTAGEGALLRSAGAAVSITLTAEL